MKTRNNFKPCAHTRVSRGRRAANAASPFTAIEFQRILLPIDFTAPSQIAVRYAKALARQFGARLVLLHVVEPVSSTADFGYGPVVCLRTNPRSIKQSQKLLHAIGRRQFDSACQCDTLVRSGVASDEIAKAAKELKADLIIISVRGHTGAIPSTGDSTAERLVRCAACPVLVLHAKEPVFVPQRSTARSHYENQTRN